MRRRASVRFRYQGGDQARPGRALEYLSGIRFPMTAAEVELAVETQGEKPNIPAAARYAKRNGLFDHDPTDFFRRRGHG